MKNKNKKQLNKINKYIAKLETNKLINDLMSTSGKCQNKQMNTF